MGQSTVVENEVLTVEDGQADNLAMIREGLKIVKDQMSGPDINLLAVKIKRDVYTVRRYLNGEVRDEQVGLRLLNYCNGFIAINNNAADEKHRLQY